MRPLTHPQQNLQIVRLALIWLLLMIGLASLAHPASAQAADNGPAHGQPGQYSSPTRPSPEPDPRLCAELLAESNNSQTELDLPGVLPGWSLLRSPPVPHKAIAASGLHVPDPLLGRYQANAPPRA